MKSDVADQVPAATDGEQHSAADESTSSSGRSAGDQSKLPCAFFMRTGTCAYGDRCKFYHPVDRPALYMNSRGLPLRPDEPECSFYMRNGWCAFADTCKFHHPELPGTAGNACLPDGQASQQQQQQQRAQKQPQTHVRLGPPIHKQPHAIPIAHPMAGVAHMGAYPGMHPAGPGYMVPYGYYPAMAGHPRMYPMAAPSPLIHPVMHMRPAVTAVPVHGPVIGLANNMQHMNIGSSAVPIIAGSGSMNSKLANGRSTRQYNGPAGSNGHTGSNGIMSRTSRPAQNAQKPGSEQDTAADDIVATSAADALPAVLPGATAGAPAGDASELSDN
eukprot:GHRR01000623.1.p1 GENE.GHRR01000623.1~~GHRR01000623.1.p1  ORF type:complete len:330 (+),score=102.74 GHRR01000623.1:248-1237(+)